MRYWVTFQRQQKRFQGPVHAQRRDFGLQLHPEPKSPTPYRTKGPGHAELEQWNPFRSQASRKIWCRRPFAINDQVPSSSDRGTQELEMLAVVIVDRLKWLKLMESCVSRNWNTWPTWLQEVDKPQGVCKWSCYLSHPSFSREGLCMAQIKTCWSVDKEIQEKLATFIWLSFFHTPYLPFFSPYKRLASDEMLRGFLGYITCHLLRLLPSE